MIIFQSLLTILEASSIIFEAAGAIVEIDLSLKSNHYDKIHRGQIRESHCTLFECNPVQVLPKCSKCMRKKDVKL
jgi:hypothetical protein